MIYRHFLYGFKEIKKIIFTNYITGYLVVYEGIFNH